MFQTLGLPRLAAAAALLALLTLQSCSCEHRADGGDPNHGAEFESIDR